MAAGIEIISILGCGWLGLPLGQHLAKEGFTVNGSTTDKFKAKTLEKNQIQPFQIELNPHWSTIEGDNFLKTDVLIIAIPPRIRTFGVKYHLEQIQSLIEKLTLQESLPNIIYTSSTSIYPKQNKEVDENEPKESLTNPTLLSAEILLKNYQKKTTILRCGGLMGYNRIPGLYFAGAEANYGKEPINYVHRDDVILIISEIIKQQQWGQVYNVVAPEHPTRQEVVEKTQRDWDIPPGKFVPPELGKFKIISSDKVQKDLNYQFQYPNPLDFRYEKQKLL